MAYVCIFACALCVCYKCLCAILNGAYYVHIILNQIHVENSYSKPCDLIIYSTFPGNTLQRMAACVCV